MQQSVVPARKSSGGMKWVLVGCGGLAVLCVCLILVGAIAVMTGVADPVLALLGLSKAQAAKYAPADAPFFASMDIDLQQAANFEKVWGAFRQSAQTQSSLDDFKKQFNQQVGCDFDADIASWWGPDVAVFLTDAKNLSSPSNLRGGQAALPNLVFAIGTRDQAKALAALDKCTTKNRPTATETYKNVEVRLFDEGAAAVTRNYMLIATTSDAMHAAIDASAGATPNLAQSPKYANAIARLPSSRVATYYADVQSFVAGYQQSLSGIQPQALDTLASYQSVAGSVAFTDNGIRLDAAVAFQTDKMPACTQQLLKQLPNANTAIKAVPANVLFYASGMNVKGTWDCSLSQMDATTQRQFQDTLNSLNKQMGIDINADLFSWFTGEFAIAVTPSKPLAEGMPGIGGIILVEAKDKDLITTKTRKIASALSVAGLKFQDQTIKGAAMKVGKLGSPDDPAAPSVGYGFVGNYFALGLPVDALSSAIDAPSNSLAADPTFKTVQAQLPASNNGYGYMSVAGIEKLVSDFLSASSNSSYQSYQKDVQPWLKPIKAIGWAAEAGKTDSQLVTFFVLVQGQ